ncbi:uncharacterized protein ARMOST_21891 [Armillaria ostoyae]|uniref:Uncharacterized protein n=1 Tax=Armillaria ostoyae TaxID=47428 RepID=A0A284SBF0_ARMOS|nr:uncharacterized protein ARMOST_21891 [Armillaria ostoyae]
MNGCASSMKEMGPSSRHNTLDCHFHFLNWSKLVSFGASLAKKKRNTDEEIVETWERDKSKPSPYITAVPYESLVQVRLRLAQEELKTPEKSLHDTSPSSFLWLGLQIEDDQQWLR